MDPQIGLNCVICYKPCGSPIYSCAKNAHLTCGLCYEDVELKQKDSISAGCVNCSLCQTPLGVDVVAEQLSLHYGMTVSCLYVESGCLTPIKATILKDHVKNCKYRPFSCFYYTMGNDHTPLCKVPVAMKDFDHHYGQIHSHRRWNGASHNFTYPTKYKFSRKDSESSQHWGRIKALQFTPQLIQHDGKMFTINAALGRYAFHWWISILGGEEDAQEYSYTTRLVMSASVHQSFENTFIENANRGRMPVLPFHEYKYFDSFCGMYCSERASRVAQFYTTESSELRNDYRSRVTVSINIIKNRDE